MNHNPGFQKRSVPHDNPMLSPEGERLAKRHNGCCSDSCKTSKMNPAGTPHKPSKDTYVSPSSSTVRSSFIINSINGWYCAAKKEVPSSEDARSSGELQTYTRSRYFLATGCNLTDAHKVEVDRIEQNIRPEIPLYVKTMSSASLVDGFLVCWQLHYLHCILNDYLSCLRFSELVLAMIRTSDSPVKSWSFLNSSILTAGSFVIGHMQRLRYQKPSTQRRNHHTLSCQS